MRKTSVSSKYRSITLWSSRADCRSRPNGFSTISRVQPSVLRRLPISRTAVGKTADGVAKLVAAVLLHRFLHAFLEQLVGRLHAGHADDCEPLRQESAEREGVERREKLAPRQVSRAAEDDEDARVGLPLELEPFEERILFERGRAHRGSGPAFALSTA